MDAEIKNNVYPMCKSNRKKAMLIFLSFCRVTHPDPIRMDLHNFIKMNPDPHLCKSLIRIRVKVKIQELLF